MASFPRRATFRRPARATILLCATLLLVPTGCRSKAEAAAPGGTEVTLAFAGDVHFMGRVAKLLADPGTAFGPIADALSSSDLTIVNLETTITRRTTAEQKRYLFRTDERSVAALRAAGVDGVSLANNHTFDYGRDGLTDTVDATRTGALGAFGAGRNALEAFAPWRTTVRGVRVAVFGFSLVDELATESAAADDRSGIAIALDGKWEKRALAAVSAARADSDLVIVVPHWGTENVSCPNPNQKRFAAALAEAGADVVVGAHAHVLQGDGWVDRTYVAYGMGNFLWYSSGLTPAAVNTGVLKLTVRGRTVVRHDLVPALVSATGQPVPLTGQRADAELRRYANLRNCTGLAVRPSR